MYPQSSVSPLPGDQDRARRFRELIDALPNKRVAVVGDVIADEFISGRIDRVSREAPVLILTYDSTQVVAGGAGNAASNVAALGGRALLCGLLGRDGPATRLLASLPPGVATGGLVRPRGYVTPTKTRILAGGVHSAKQQVVRIDRTASAVDRAARRSFGVAVRRAVARADAVVLSDYGSGLVTPALAGDIARALGRRTRRRPVPLVVDSRYRLLDYGHLPGVTACTPNESEVERLLDLSIGDDAGALERAGRTLLRRLRATSVLITRGSRGMALFERRRPTVHVPIFGSDEIADVTGAGDTVIATLALALAAGGSAYEGARLANYAGGLVVMKRGTAVVTADELRGAVDADHEEVRGGPYCRLR